MAPYNNQLNNHNQFPYYEDTQQTQQPFVLQPIIDEVVNKVTEIVNEFIPNTTSVYDAIDTSAGGAVTDSLLPNFVSQAGNGIGEAVTDSLLPDFVSQAGNGIGEAVTEVKELTTNFNGDGDSVIGSITSTIRSYISDKEEDHDYHNNINGGSMEHHVAKGNPYLYLVIVLAVLVVLATVALLLYIRHKRSASAKISPGVSIVGKTFEPHTFGDKTLAGQSARSEQYGACDDQAQDSKTSKSTKK